MAAKRAPRILTQAMPPASEADILKQTREFLRLKGWSVWRMQQGLGSPKGFPDLIAIRRGQVLWIEVKTRTGRLSQYQEAFRDELTVQAGRYVVVRGIDDLLQLERESAQ